MQTAPNTNDSYYADNAKNADAADRPAFENPFGMDDLLVFDDVALRYLVSHGPLAGRLDELALALVGASPGVSARIRQALPSPQRAEFAQAVQHAPAAAPGDDPAIRWARRATLDALFWELTYWKTPELYEALTEGEHIHPGVFRSLAPWLTGATALDVGAGTGRATFACLRQGARRVIAVEPSPGLRQMLQRKAAALGVAGSPSSARVAPRPGRFDSLPLPDACVDISLSCSAFTAEPTQGGEAGLAELRRVTRRGGHIVVIWPRPCDHDWYAAHGFAYTSIPAQTEMRVQFRSRWWALACAHRFYGRNAAVMRYLARHNTAELPISLIGFNPPQDYFALSV